MEIKTKKITSKISVSERETHIYRSGDGWVMDSTVPKDFNAALRKGWTPVEQTVYDDGARSVSEEQREKATAALAKYRAEK